MAQPKRIKLHTLTAARPSTDDLIEKVLTPKGRRSDPPACTPTVRYTLNLFEPGDRIFPEFIYTELQENKVNTMFKDEDLQSEFVDEGSKDDGMDSFLKKLEKKYSKRPNKPKDRMQDLAGYGYGYDEDDSFIDNSEAYDVYVPAAITTEQGGFYMNSGVLEFRDASDSECDVEKPKPTQKRKRKDGTEQKKKKKKKKLKDDGMMKGFIDESSNAPEKRRTEVAAGSTGVPAIPLRPADAAGEGSLGLAEPLQVHLPGGLSTELQENMSELLLAAKTSETGTKLKFFTPEINSVLLKIELECREQSGHRRSKVFRYLSAFLPCTRKTLLKRARKLVIAHTTAQEPSDTESGARTEGGRRQSRDGVDLTEDLQQHGQLHAAKENSQTTADSATIPATSVL